MLVLYTMTGLAETGCRLNAPYETWVEVFGVSLTGAGGW
jgi:hypothetical protein